MSKRKKLNREDLENWLKQTAAKKKASQIKASLKSSPREEHVKAFRKARQFTPQRILHLRRHYGLTLEDFQKLLHKQFRCCRICQAYMSKPYVDHDHNTGKIRGLLCSSCNSGLGFFKENTRILGAAIQYLLEHNSDRKLEEDKLAETLMEELLKTPKGIVKNS